MTRRNSVIRGIRQPIGILHKPLAERGKDGRPRLHTVCGILMHSSLAVTTEGLPLGLVAIKFWTRSKFKGSHAPMKKVNPLRVLIEAKESARWLENLKQSTERLGEPSGCIHIGNRESDIYELFCAAKDSGMKFLVRTCVDRLAGDGQHTFLFDEVDLYVQIFDRLRNPLSCGTGGLLFPRITRLSGCSLRYDTMTSNPGRPIVLAGLNVRELIDAQWQLG